MKILFIGDIYGSRGLLALKYFLPEIKEEYKPNLIIVNGENTSNGRGISEKIYKELMSLGVSAVTMGNWVWGNRELYDFIENSNIVRPINYFEAPGKGALLINYNNKKVLVINALGRTFMNPNIECPFRTVEKAIDEFKPDYSIVDFHAEATSEKVALGHYLDGKATAILGTHTHVQTADNRVLPKGTLYITDVGMTGPLNGVIGVNKEIVIERFLNGFARPNEIEEGPIQINGVILDLVNHKIERINLQSESI